MTQNYLVLDARMAALSVPENFAEKRNKLYKKRIPEALNSIQVNFYKNDDFVLFTRTVVIRTADFG